METDRRSFLIAGARLALIVPAGYALVSLSGCAEEDECEGAGSASKSGETLTYVSSCESGHVHDFTLMTSEISSPPASGISRDTSEYEDDGHTHMVELTEADLTQIQNGDAVMKQTSVTLGHSHMFAFELV